MKTIGVGVEGPSDLRFWRRLLHRCFRDSHATSFDVHNMSNRPKLIRDTDRLLDLFQDRRYVGGIVLLDLDKNPCVTDLRTLFSDRILAELTKPLHDRFLHLGVARTKLESWYLADPDAIRTVLPNTTYDATAYDPRWGKKKLGTLCRENGITYNEIAFAEKISPHFSVERAIERSDSLRIAWKRIVGAVGSATE